VDGARAAIRVRCLDCMDAVTSPPERDCFYNQSVLVDIPFAIKPWGAATELTDHVLSGIWSLGVWREVAHCVIEVGYRMLLTDWETNALAMKRKKLTTYTERSSLLLIDKKCMERSLV
jgi:hypothetical protein